MKRGKQGPCYSHGAGEAGKLANRWVTYKVMTEREGMYEGHRAGMGRGDIALGFLIVCEYHLIQPSEVTETPISGRR